MFQLADMENQMAAQNEEHEKELRSLRVDADNRLSQATANTNAHQQELQ